MSSILSSIFPASLPVTLPDYAELHCISNFTFLRGASHPRELVARARQLGYQSLAITDECSLAGVVRAFEEAENPEDTEAGCLHLIIGSELLLDCGTKLVLLAMDMNGYGNLSEWISRARCRAPKGEYSMARSELEQGDHLHGLPGCIALYLGRHDATPALLQDQAGWVARTFGERAWIAVELLHRMDDAEWLERLTQLSEHSGLPLVAAGDVHMHLRSRKPLQDVLTATRLRKPVADCGLALQPNAEQHLRPRMRLAGLYAPELLRQTLVIAARCTFSLKELKYQYPEEIAPNGMPLPAYLRRLVYEGAAWRFPQGIPAGIQLLVEKELGLIAELEYEPYFLTVFDIVRYARSQHILCQGRGSAANSAVCYCLGITEIDPSQMNGLIERFISRERKEPPDIDVDFEHDRREEVMQYIYNKYGRTRTALTAALVMYRPRSAIKDVGRALGMDFEHLNRLSRSHQWWDGHAMNPQRLQEQGLDPASPLVQKLMSLTAMLIGFPRHLSQHSGGFVIARGQLTRLVPIENAAMENRNVIQWDKDDLDAVGLLKIDVLALGMLSAIRRALDLVSLRRGQDFTMQSVPREDPQVYRMISSADTVGVFQIESRAQMSMLPRMQPRTFYDLVIEVAIVRPGPIQGGMVHPYLKRRQGIEKVEYPKDAIKPALERTLGIPIFQEQVMQVAIIAADFTPGEADQLRRAMAAWKRRGGVHKFHDRLIEGMRKNGYDEAFSARIFSQIEGFGEYGFPESHAASFALLVYISSWLKCHEPAAFLAALLNSQPMGFYSPSQLVQDARRHRVVVRPADVLVSDWDSTLEEIPDAPSGGQPAVRLGLSRVHGLSEAGAQRLVEVRAIRGFENVDDLLRRAELSTHDLQALANANALLGLAGHRREAAWQVAGMAPMPKLLKDAPIIEAPLALPAAPEGQEILADYRSMGLTLNRHPLALLRPKLAAMKLYTAHQLRVFGNGRLVCATGLVTGRQRPGTAKGTVFVTLEDETGNINVIVWPDIVAEQRTALLNSRLLTVYGVWQRQGQVMHLVARQLYDHSAWLGELAVSSRNFH